MKHSIFRHPDPLPLGINSGYVMTVLGPLPVSEMGVTLMHEHILTGCVRQVGAALLLWRSPFSGNAGEYGKPGRTVA